MLAHKRTPWGHSTRSIYQGVIVCGQNMWTVCANKSYALDLFLVESKTLEVVDECQTPCLCLCSSLYAMRPDVTRNDHVYHHSITRAIMIFWFGFAPPPLSHPPQFISLVHLHHSPMLGNITMRWSPSCDVDTNLIWPASDRVCSALLYLPRMCDLWRAVVCWENLALNDMRRPPYEVWWCNTVEDMRRDWDTYIQPLLHISYIYWVIYCEVIVIAMSGVVKSCCWYIYIYMYV